MSADLTQATRSAIVSSSEPSLAPIGIDEGLLAGRMLKMLTESRRAKLAEIIAIEEMIGMKPRECKHCGKPVR